MLLGIVGISVSLFEDKLDEKFLIVATEICVAELIAVDEADDIGYLE